MNDALSTIPHVSPLSDADEALYERFFRARSRSERFTYSNSWTYVVQAARNESFKYFDGETLFTITRRPNSRYAFRILDPMGHNPAHAISEVSRRLVDYNRQPILLAKVAPDVAIRLSASGFRTPHWNSSALEELPDDIFSQPICDLKEYSGGPHRPPSGHQFLKLRQKLSRFLQGKHKCEVRPLTSGNAQDAIAVLHEWKNGFMRRYGLRNIALPAIDSYYFDPYLVLISAMAPRMSQKEHIAFLLYIDERPSALSLLSEISDCAVGQYVSLCVNNIKGLSEYLVTLSFKQACERGYRFVNMGGAETKSLFDFNKKFGPISFATSYFLELLPANS